MDAVILASVGLAFALVSLGASVRSLVLLKRGERQRAHLARVTADMARIDSEWPAGKVYWVTDDEWARAFRGK